MFFDRYVGAGLAPARRTRVPVGQVCTRPAHPRTRPYEPCVEQIEEDNQMKSTADVVIVGAGVIGCSTAFHLAARGIVDVAVVEMGQVGSGSTSKSAAMLSLQFCHDELSARLAQLSYARYMRFEEEIGVPIDFKPTGWLSVGTASDAAELIEGARMLNRLGVATEVLDPAEIKRRYPEIRVDDLVVGTFGPDDGPFDPHMIVWGYAKRAMALGARVHQGVRATGVEVTGGHLAGVHTTAGFIAAPIVVNAAGPWAAEVGRWAGIEIPILNRSRTILVTGAFPAIPPDRPFVEDVSAGWYYRPEGDGVLMGYGPRAGGRSGQSPDQPGDRRCNHRRGCAPGARA